MTKDTTFCPVFASTGTVLDTLADLKAACGRLAAFGIVGTAARPLGVDEPTDKEESRVERARMKWEEEGNDPAEFSDFPKTWVSGIDPAFEAIVVQDARNVLATLMAARKGGIQVSWNLCVNGFTVPCSKILEAVAGTKAARLTPRAIVAACKGR
jgi:hypothetical protein